VGVAYVTWPLQFLAVRSAILATAWLLVYCPLVKSVHQISHQTMLRLRKCWNAVYTGTIRTQTVKRRMTTLQILVSKIRVRTVTQEPVRARLQRATMSKTHHRQRLADVVRRCSAVWCGSTARRYWKLIYVNSSAMCCSSSGQCYKSKLRSVVRYQYDTIRWYKVQRTKQQQTVA